MIVAIQIGKKLNTILVHGVLQEWRMILLQTNKI